MIKVFFPKINLGSEIRGIGSYKNFLVENLKKNSDFRLVDSWQNADVIHYPFFDFYFNTLKIFPDKKHVVTIHDVIPLVFKNKYPSGLKGALKFIQQKNKLKKVDRIITDSNNSAYDIEKYLNIKSNKIKVTYLAGNPNLKKPKDNVIQLIKQNLNLPEKYILYVGDINYNKNIPNLLKSLTLIDQNVKLLLVGRNFFKQNISEWQAIDEILAKFNLTNRVRFLIDVKKDDFDVLSVLYNQAQCYVQPSLYEGFGLPVLEAWQCENLVIAGDNSSLKEIGNNFIFKTKVDFRSLAGSINFILKLNHEKREEKLKEIRKYLKKFSWEKTAQETFKIYQEIL
jgi:glycosyltransferase involved in cell wall biosynthesis